MLQASDLGQWRSLDPSPTSCRGRGWRFLSWSAYHMVKIPLQNSGPSFITPPVKGLVFPHLWWMIHCVCHMIQLQLHGCSLVPWLCQGRGWYCEVKIGVCIWHIVLLLYPDSWSCHLLLWSCSWKFPQSKSLWSSPEVPAMMSVPWVYHFGICVCADQLFPDNQKVWTEASLVV